MNAIWEGQFHVDWECKDGDCNGSENSYTVSAESLEEALRKIRKTIRANYLGKLTIDFESIVRKQYLDT